MDLIGQKWKLPILWYIADAENQTLRYRELERKVVGITATMLTKCLRELEQDKFITRKQYSTIPPTVEYTLANRGRTLIPALESVYKWADEQMKIIVSIKRGSKGSRIRNIHKKSQWCCLDEGGN